MKSIQSGKVIWSDEQKRRYELWESGELQHPTGADNGGIPYWVTGRITWNANGLTGERECSLDPNDYMGLGYAEWPDSDYEEFRQDVLHGMMMNFPKEDIATFVNQVSDQEVNKLESDMMKMISQIRKAIRM